LIGGEIRLRETEIAESDVTGRVEEDVLGFEISARRNEFEPRSDQLSTSLKARL